MKIKTTLILALIIVNSFVAHAQLNLLKESIMDLFWYLPMQTEKFDIRAKFHSSNNFTNVRDNDLRYNSDGISGNFENNKLLNSLGINNKVFVFINSTGRPEQWGISSSYKPDEYNKCKMQYEQVLTYLSKYSFKVTQSTNSNVGDKLVGRGNWFYSSQAMLNARKPYATITYAYRDYLSQYVIDINYYPDALK